MGSLRPTCWLVGWIEGVIKHHVDIPENSRRRMKGSKNPYGWCWFLRLESLGPVQLPTALVLAACGIWFASCSQQVEYTDEQRVCIARQYTTFDPKKLSQCVDVCKVCMRGNTVTCNTSCKLKGAV